MQFCIIPDTKDLAHKIQDVNEETLKIMAQRNKIRNEQSLKKKYSL
ncbi:MAG: hypothetical protein NTX49_08175 [Chlamydiae bacterium]|nr:hypothetical protein [Chlamydiota bacterium]